MTGVGDGRYLAAVLDAILSTSAFCLGGKLDILRRYTGKISCKLEDWLAVHCLLDCKLILQIFQAMQVALTRSRNYLDLYLIESIHGPLETASRPFFLLHMSSTLLSIYFLLYLFYPISFPYHTALLIYFAVCLLVYTS